MVINLSEQLSYILYESDEDLVALDKELSILDKFIALEKLKTDKAETITFSVEGDSNTLFIPPLVLLPLVQNMFEFLYYKKIRR